LLNSLYYLAGLFDYFNLFGLFGNYVKVISNYVSQNFSGYFWVWFYDWDLFSRKVIWGNFSWEGEEKAVEREWYSFVLSRV